MVLVICLVVAILCTIVVAFINHRYDVILQDKKNKLKEILSDEEWHVVNVYLENVRINKGDLFKYKVEKKEEE